MDDLLKESQDNARLISDSRLEQAASLPEEFRVTREFCREMGHAWFAVSKNLSKWNAGLLDSPLVSELETATTRALLLIEERLARVEEALLPPHDSL